MLRNAIVLANSPQNRKPTLVVGPNEPVLRQWFETLVKAGVPVGDIDLFRSRSTFQVLDGPKFFLLTRYQLQTEMKHMITAVKDRNSVPVPQSRLFPGADRECLFQMRSLYRIATGKAKEQEKWKILCGRSPASRMRICLQGAALRIKRAFCTVVIDEAHFLKNLFSYWGLGAGLLGLLSDRVVPMVR